MKKIYSGLICLAVILTITLVFLPIAALADSILVSENLGSDAYSASSSALNRPPSAAFDGDITDYTQWNAGWWPEQWIQVDLQQNYNIAEVKLYVEQTPSPALTEHLVFISDSTTFSTPTYVFYGVTNNGDILDVNFAQPISGRYVRIDTTLSPSWVAWREVQVYATSVPEPATMLLLGLGLIGLAMIRRRMQ